MISKDWMVQQILGVQADSEAGSMTVREVCAGEQWNPNTGQWISTRTSD